MAGSQVMFHAWASILAEAQTSWPTPPRARATPPPMPAPVPPTTAATVNRLVQTSPAPLRLAITR